MLSAASAASLAWLISWNCCMWLRAAARSTWATLSCALDTIISEDASARIPALTRTEGLRLLARAVVHGVGLDRAPRRSRWHRSCVFHRRRVSPRYHEVGVLVLPHVLGDASCSFRRQRGTRVFGKVVRSKILHECGPVHSPCAR